MRINKFLANNGVASRRTVDELIKEGKIKVNGKIANLGQSVDPAIDKITLNDKEIINREEENVYIVLNKPAGYTSTVAKIKGEKNILELVPTKVRLYPVGRLDRDSTGLIILTNDGELALKLTHPKFHVPKTYEIKVLGKVTQTQLDLIKNGIALEDGKTKPAEVKIKSESLPHHSVLTITLFEGKKRQIRRMMAYLHLHILNLCRISMGSLILGDLELGKYRSLTKEEVSALKNL